MVKMLLGSNSLHFAFNKADYELKQFPDGEIYFRLRERVEVILQNGFPMPNKSIIELILMQDVALVDKLIMPYFPYARQDKQFLEGESLSLRAVLKLVYSLGIKDVYTIEPHFFRECKDKKMYGVRVYNICVAQYLVEYLLKSNDLRREEVLLLSPDLGNSERVREIAKQYDLEHYYFTKKRKDAYNVEYEDVRKDIADREIILIDDIISTGSTAISLLNNLDPKSKKYAAFVHGLFLNNAYEKLKPYVNNIATSNTIEHITNKIRVEPFILERLKE